MKDSSSIHTVRPAAAPEVRSPLEVEAARLAGHFHYFANKEATADFVGEAV